MKVWSLKVYSYSAIAYVATLFPSYFGIFSAFFLSIPPGGFVLCILFNSFYFSFWFIYIPDKDNIDLQMLILT